MNDLYIYLIVALLPLSSLMLILEKNPYHALVIRGILGAVAVLAYVVLGGADVALTEALMGTLLAVMLYIVAVRSSLVMRLGVLESFSQSLQSDESSEDLINNIRQAISQSYLRLELVTYANKEALEIALNNKEIHGFCLCNQNGKNNNLQYQINLRIPRLIQLLRPVLDTINNNKIDDKLIINKL